MPGFVKSDVEPTLSEPTLSAKFISAGGAACVADLCTFPLDTAKVRLQLQGETRVNLVGNTSTLLEASQTQFKYHGIYGTLRTIAKEEGARAWYNGITAGLQRQMCFASVRIGLYDQVKLFYFDLFGVSHDHGASIPLRILAGITTGGMAVGCAQPTDVVKVRMQAQSTGPARYTGTMNAYSTIAKDEGIRGLWKGTCPNITRNALVNAAEMVSYDLIKTKLIKSKLMSDNMPCHFVSAFCAGFVTTVVASPVDVVKTRFMNSEPGVYSGALQCATRMYREGGAIAFYKGFMPSFIRLGTWNIVMFVVFEQFKRLACGAKCFRKEKELSLEKDDIEVSAVKRTIKTTPV